MDSVVKESLQSRWSLNVSLLIPFWGSLEFIPSLQGTEELKCQ